MSRHRNVRSMNYEDEYYDEDDVYGHSIEDNYCISPGTAAQFTYNRERDVALSNFMDEQGVIPEEDEGEDTDEGTPRSQHRSSLDYTRPKLTDIDEAKLNSVLEEVRNVIGESVPEGAMVDTIMRHNFSVEGSLNELLNQQDAPKPQREPRKDRRNRSQELDDEIENDNCYNLQDNVFSYIPQTTGGVMKFGDSVSPQSPSFLLQSRNVSASPLTHPVVVKQQCATGQYPLHSDIMDVGGDVDGKVCKKVTGESLLDIPHSHNTRDQKFNKSKDTSIDHVDIKQSLSTLAKEHGLRNKESISTVQNITEGSNTTIQPSDLAKDPYASNIPTAKKSTQSSLSNQAYSHLHNNSKHTSTLSTCNSPSTKAHLQNKTDADSACGSEANSKDVVNNKSMETQNKLSSSLSCLAKEHLNTTQGSSPVPSTFGIGHRPHAPTAPSSIDSSSSGLNKAHSENSSPLSQLAKTHSDKSSQLSQLAKAHSDSSSPLSQLAKTHSDNSSPLSQLAKSHSDKSSQLSQLAKAHSDNLSHFSGLAKAHLTSPPSLSGLAKVHSENSSPLSQLAKTHSDNPTPLSQLAQAHSSKPSHLSGVAKVHSGSSSVGLSLSQLAEAHGVKSKAGKENNTSDNKENQGVLKQKQDSMLPSEMLKNKSDKDQIMLSLSSLIEKQGKKEDQIVVKRTETNTGGVNNKDKSRESAEFDNDGETAKAKAVSLADLAMRKGPQVLKDAKLKPYAHIKNVSKVSKSVDNDTTEEDSDVVSADSKIESEDLDVSVGKVTFTDDMQIENFKQYLKGPSGIGNTLCLEIKVRPDRKKGRKYKQRKFSYRCQLKGVREMLNVEMKKIKPFDFSTPSPDDLIKTKQKQAFNRSGK